MGLLKAGQVIELEIARKIETGYVLTDGTEEILVHANEVENTLEVADTVEVFLYHDKKGILIGTTTIPSVGPDVFDWAEVTEVVPNLGVFVDIGTTKHTLVSKDDLPLFQSVWPQVGDELYVVLSNDKKGRLLANPVSEFDFGNNWDRAPEDLRNKAISGRVFRTDREGAVIITEESYRGFIHHTERKVEPRLGEWVKGRVIAVKEDGTLNVSMLPKRKEARITDAQMILNLLKDNDGELPFTDKSDPEAIKEKFDISKAAFKRALGKLMKEAKIVQDDSKISLRKIDE
ncbi:S1 RNA-binding domain-containing protein [Paraliobacillus sediminis]|uniref:CvfB family protein n=1 Tax=Paraliobacillus sediminis TaxID=1885916 RepID=UPI000E3DDC90|nr:S1-like domain-containing RNA-binding protein [Paraliobacillus sediminis]